MQSNALKITPGDSEALSDIFGYILAYSLILTSNLIIKYFVCGTVQNIDKLKKCFALTIVSIYMSVYLYNLDLSRTLY